MVFPKEEKLVHSIRLSSVGPGQVTGSDVVHTPGSMDLAMKLHYLRGVYYFNAQATQGMTIKAIKEPMFLWLNDYYMTCGRFRRSPDTGRPYMKCNDCGARFIEGKCDKTMDEWLEMLSEDCELRKLLVSDQVMGPELSFSPPLLIQVTHFKCGGFSLSLNWAHILGDVFSVIDFINNWGQLLAGLQTGNPKPQISNRNTTPKSPAKADPEPLSVRRVGPLGDHWIYSPGSKMGNFTFHLTQSQLAHLRSKFFGHMKPYRVPPFECLCAVLWQCIANVKEEEPKAVTICKKDPRRAIGVPSNSQKISAIWADSSVKGSDPSELLGLIMDQAIQETALIEEAVERDNGASDFIIYGANLTFVDIGEADLYGLELNGQKPLFADYAVEGVGEEGLVLVQPGPKSPKLSGHDGDEGRFVTVTLPKNLLPELKGELQKHNVWLEKNISS